MANSVYLETTVPSAFVTTRSDTMSLYRRDQTRTWWASQRRHFDLFVSQAVLAELRKGDWPGQQEALRLVDGLPELAIDEEVAAVARRYVREKLMPANLAGDALHLALASVHEMEFLVTWNIRHLANPRKVNHLVILDRRMGLFAPQVVTPEMLWLEEDER